jgi:hypothetical protein
MSALPPVGFDDLVTKRHLDEFAIKYDLANMATKRDFELLSARFDNLEQRLDARFAGLDARIDRLFYLMVIAVLGMLGAVTTLIVSL